MTRNARRFDGIELSLIRQIAALATPETVDLGLGEPNLAPDETLLEMARGAAATSWRYSPNAGHLPVRRAVARYLDDAVDPADEICITAGTEEALYAVMQAYVEEGDEVLIPDPGFLAYPTLVKLAGGRSVAYPLDSEGWTVDLSNLESRMTEKTKAVVLNSPANPTGGIVSNETLQAIVRLCESRDVLLVIDEVYRELQYEMQQRSAAGSSAHVVAVGGLSKSHGLTGLRLGWVTAAAEVMTPILRAHQYIATCASVFSQELARRVLEDEIWNRTWLMQGRSQFTQQRGVMIASIEQELGVPMRPPAGAFYAFVPIPACRSVDLARQLASDAGVLAIPGVAFGAGGEGFLRLSYATSEEAIREGVRRIGRHLERVEECSVST